jgi:integrase
MPRLTDKALTDTAVRKALPHRARYDLYDAALRGFGLRVAVSGTKTWFVMRRVRGRMVRHKLGRYPEVGLAEARSRAAVALRMMSDGENPNSKRGDLFESVFEEWMTRDQANNRSVGNVRNAITKHALPDLRSRPIGEIHKADILRLIDRIVDSGSPVQANRVLSYLKRLFNWCKERDLLAANPAMDISGPTKEVSRERVLSQKELREIVRAAARIGYPWGSMVLMLILTGQRLEEVANATWSEINFEDRSLSLGGNRTKNGRPHYIPLSDQATEVLANIPRKSEHWVFTTNGTGPVRGFSQAKGRIDKESGVNGWTFHDLRRSFATHATETLGVSPVVVDKILNHSSGAVKGVAAVYQRGEYRTERRTALENWGKYIMSPPQSGENLFSLPSHSPQSS